MKKILTLLAIITAFCSAASAQSHFPQENFYSIKSRMDTFYDSIATIIGRAAVVEDESGYGQYQRWVYFWEPLVQPSGEFTIPLNAMNKLANDYLSISHAPVSALGNWAELGPNVQPSEGPSVSQAGSALGGTGVAHFIITDPQDPTFLVTGSPAGGLFYSSNSGADWLNANTDNTLPILSVSHCAIDPNNSNNWFISTGDKTAIFDGSHATAWNITTGIYRKTGIGFNWQRIADENDLGASDGAGGVYSGWQIKKLLIDNANSNIMYAATSFGLYKTYNALEPVASNVIWVRLNSIDDPTGLQSISDIEFKPGSSSILYATRDYANYIPGSTANILVSNDFGSTWNLFNTGITLTNVRRIEIEVSQNPADINMLFALTANPINHSRFYKINTSSTSTWADKGMVPFGDYDLGGCNFAHVTSLCINKNYASPNENILYGDYHPIFQSINGGTTWPISSGANQVHNDIHDIICPDGTTLYAATDGGIFKSTTGGVSWTPQNNGLGIGTINNISTSETNPNLTLQGYQDCGTNLFDGTSWRHIFGGDGQKPMIDYKDPTYMYASYQNGTIRRSEDFGTSFPFSAASSGTLFPFPTYSVFNSENPSTFYQAGNEVYRTTNRGDGSSSTWVAISNFQISLPSSYVLSIHTSPSNPDYLYAFTIGGGNPRLMKTTDANNPIASAIIWNEIVQDPSLPAFWIGDIAVDENDPEIFYAIYTGFNDPGNNFVDKKIWHYNGHTSTWTNITNGLPNTSVFTIVKEKGTDGGLYIGTHASGVFYTNNKLLTTAPTNSWQPFINGLPNVDVKDLEITYKTNIIRAGTYGRGLWESSLVCPDTGPLSLSGFVTQNKFEEVDGLITSTETFASGLNVSYRSTTEIKLLPGFDCLATPGSEFKAFIHNCDSPGNSFKHQIEDGASNESITYDNDLLKYTKESQLIVIPNPNNGKFQLVVSNNGKIPQTRQITVFDIRGSKIWESQNKTDGTFNIDISSYPKGFYYVKVVDISGKVQVEKIINQ